MKTVFFIGALFCFIIGLLLVLLVHQVAIGMMFVSIGLMSTGLMIVTRPKSNGGNP